MSVETQQFTGTDQYIATDSLKLAVKAVVGQRLDGYGQNFTG